MINNFFVCPNITYQKKKVPTQILLFCLQKTNAFFKFWGIFNLISDKVSYSKLVHFKKERKKKFPTYLPTHLQQPCVGVGTN